MLIITIGLLLLLALSVFQFLLILKKPLGEFAWGGGHKVLPTKLRIASGFSILLYIVFALFLVATSGLIQTPFPQSIIEVTAWVLVGYFALGTVMNLISRSKKERAVMTPTALTLAIIFLLVAL